MQSPIEQLDHARSLVTDVIQTLETLLTRDPSEWSTAGHAARLELLQALERLDRPTFKIATFGTTSSGKSTLANAIVGRRLAPMEAGELSAGTLRLVDGDEGTLTIEPSAEGAWESGQWKGTDRALSDRLTETLNRFHQQSKSSTVAVAPPQATITGPLLPSRWPTLLYLPEGVRFELLDLPGINHAHDQKNIRVIQQEVLGSFCLVVLDYGHTDTTNRAKLLEELRRAVELLGGKTSTMLFLLNRVDLRNPEDIPLENRVEELRKEMAVALKLQDPPELLPISALPLYYAQCIWGPGDLRGEPVTPIDEALPLFKDFFQFSGKVLDRRKDKEILKRIDAIDEQDDLSADDRRWLLQTIGSLFGGNELWGRLAERISANFVELVIHPAVIKAVEATERAVVQHREDCRIRKITTREALEADRARLTTALDALNIALQQRTDALSKRMKTSVDHLKLGTPQSVRQAVEILGKGFQPLRDAIDTVRDDIYGKLILKIRDGLKESKTENEIASDISPAVGSPRATELTNAIGRLRMQGYIQAKVRDGWKLSVPVAERDKLKPLLDAHAKLYLSVRAALGQRAAARLQENSSLFEGALQQLLDDEIAQVQQQALSLVDDAEQIATIMRDARIKAPNFPDISFSLTPPEPGTKTEAEKIIVEQRSCREDVTKTVEHKYMVVDLKSADMMADEWLAGVNNGISMLWEQLGRWIQEGIQLQRNRYVEAIERVLRTCSESYEKRLVHLERGATTQEEHIDDLLSVGAEIAHRTNDLHQYAAVRTHD